MGYAHVAEMKFHSGLPETRCGIGATVANTANIRRALPRLFRELGIKWLVDAPCGDFNWLSTVDLSGINYVGCDVDQENLAIARGRQNNANTVTLLQVDLTRDMIPSGDLMLCREFLQHLPTWQVKDVLANYRDSGTKYLLATSHHNEENSDIPRPGGFRKLNLTMPPFNLPLPRHAIFDDDDILGLWTCEQLFAS